MRLLRHCRNILSSATILNSAKFSVNSLKMISTSSYSVRKAEINDLPQIHVLIQDSFAAMNEYFTDPGMQEMMAKAAQSMCEGELSAQLFEKTYFTSFGHHFWVIEDLSDGAVQGCVGIKRHTADSAELVRMAVNPKVRGCGLGNLLVNELKKYCDETGVLQVTLSTANPRAGNFYEKNGFVDLAPADSKVLRMIMYLGERVIRRVAIVGGTHGNERIGIELIRQWAADKTALERSTFKTSVVIGNPLATKANVRYCDADMNRQFSKKDIADRAELSKSILPSASSVSEEVSLAVSINELLGPKGAINEQYGCDFIIDLHSSNSNVGLVGMINGADKDCHALRLSQYLLKERQEEFPLLKITNSKFDKGDSINVDSISPFGIAFEVGPIVHGTLSVELLDKTRELVYASLDFIEAQNLKLLQAAAAASTATSSAASPSSEGSDPGVVRSQGRDIVLASNPATSQLIQKLPPFTEIDCYVEVSKMKYPDQDSVASNAEESLYPTLSVVHPSLEGADWTVIEEDQPAFMATDGSKKISPFVRPVIQGGHFQAPGPPEAPPPLFLLFVNEAAYQQSGVAFAVYKKISKTVF